MAEDLDYVEKRHMERVRKQEVQEQGIGDAARRRENLTGGRQDKKKSAETRRAVENARVDDSYLSRLKEGYDNDDKKIFYYREDSTLTDYKSSLATPEQNTTLYLAMADTNRKKGELNKSYYNLVTASRVVNNAPEDQGEKLAGAILERAYRLSDSAENDLKVDELAIRLIKKIEKQYGIHRRPRNLSHVVGSVAVVGFGLGLFFLSPNITGNVVGNASAGVSNWVGAVLFGIGLVGAWFWIRGRV